MQAGQNLLPLPASIADPNAPILNSSPHILQSTFVSLVTSLSVGFGAITGIGLSPGKGLVSVIGSILSS